MAVRSPLVLGDDGLQQQLQAADSLAVAPLLTSAAVTPAAGALSLGMVSLAGYEMLGMQNAHGAARLVMPFTSRMKYSLLNFPPAGSVLAMGNAPNTRFTAAGTISGYVGSSTYALRMRLTGFTSAATAGSITGYYPSQVNAPIFFVGNGSGLGGLLGIQRFMVADAVSTALMFVGYWVSQVAPTTSDPTTLTNCFGVAQVAGSSNLCIVYGGSTPQAKIDLGANFPVNTNGTDVYEVIWFSPDTDNTQIYYQVNRYTTSKTPAFTASGSLANTTPGTTLPSASSALAPVAYRTNGTTGSAVVLGLMNMDTYADS